MSNDIEIASALAEAVGRKADADLRAEIDECFSSFSERLTKMYQRYDATAPDGIDLRELRRQAFDALQDGARLRAVEKVIRSLTESA
jgi:hypothetical protein